MSYRNRPKYIILGAGITGLSLAYFLNQASPFADITVLEKKARPGGWIQTDLGDHFLFERGPHTLRLSSPYKEVCEKLFEDLDLLPEILYPHSSVKKKYLSYDQKLHPISIHPLKLLSIQNLTRISYPILKGCFKKSSADQDESIDSFCHKFFGAHITQRWIDPLVMGIFGGDLKKLSINSCFPSLKNASKSSSPLLFSLLKNMRKNPATMLSFKKGLSTLTESLIKKTKAEYLFETPAIKIDLSSKPSVFLSDQKLECDHLFSTLPSYILYDLIKNEPIEEVSYLNTIPYISYKMIHIGYHKSLQVPPGFGFLSPSWDSGQISGVIFDSEIFPSQSQTKKQMRLSVMIHEKKDLFYKSDDEIKNGVLKELQLLLNIKDKPDFFKIHSLNNAIPQYHVGHLEKVEALKEKLLLQNASFSFLGSAFYGVSVPSCIYSAYQTAQRIIKKNVLDTSFAKQPV